MLQKVSNKTYEMECLWHVIYVCTYILDVSSPVCIHSVYRVQGTHKTYSCIKETQNAIAFDLI